MNTETKYFSVIASEVKGLAAMNNHCDFEWFKDFGYEIVLNKFGGLDAITIDYPEFDLRFDEVGIRYENVVQVIKVKCPECGEWTYQAYFSESPEYPDVECENCGSHLVVENVKTRRVHYK